MKDELEFLEYIYQASKMSQENIARVRKERNIEDEMDEILKNQIISYRKISSSARNMIIRRKKDVRDIGLLSKLATYMNVKANLSKNNENSRFAQMIVQGSMVSIEEINRKIEDYNLKNKNLINLAQRLILVEEKNIENIEKFI